MMKKLQSPIVIWLPTRSSVGFTHFPNLWESVFSYEALIAPAPVNSPHLYSLITRAGLTPQSTVDVGEFCQLRLSAYSLNKQGNHG